MVEISPSRFRTIKKVSFRVFFRLYRIVSKKITNNRQTNKPTDAVSRVFIFLLLLNFSDVSSVVFVCFKGLQLYYYPSH